MELSVEYTTWANLQSVRCNRLYCFSVFHRAFFNSI